MTDFDKGMDSGAPTAKPSSAAACSTAAPSCGERKRRAARIIKLLDDIKESDPDSFAAIMAVAKKAQDGQQ